MTGVLLALALAALQPGTDIAVPAGTAVRVRLVQFVSSETSRPGDPVPFKVAHDVVVDGAVVIREGTAATGAIVEAKPYSVHWWAFWNAVRPGRLALDLTATTGVDGLPIRLRLAGGVRHFDAESLIQWEAEGTLFDGVVRTATEVRVPRGEGSDDQSTNR